MRQGASNGPLTADDLAGRTVLPQRDEHEHIPRFTILLQKMTRGDHAHTTCGFILHVFQHDPLINLGSVLCGLISRHMGNFVRLQQQSSSSSTLGARGIDANIAMLDPPFDLSTITPGYYNRLCSSYRDEPLADIANPEDLAGIAQLKNVTNNPLHPRNMCVLRFALDRFKKKKADPHLLDLHRYTVSVGGEMYFTFPSGAEVTQIAQNRFIWASPVESDGLQLAQLPWESRRALLVEKAIGSFSDVYPSRGRQDTETRAVSIGTETALSKSSITAANSGDSIMQGLASKLAHSIGNGAHIKAVYQSILDNKQARDADAWRNASISIYQHHLGYCYALETLLSQSIYRPSAFPAVTPALQQFRITLRSDSNFQQILQSATVVPFRLEYNGDEFAEYLEVMLGMLGLVIHSNLVSLLLINIHASLGCYRGTHTLGVNPCLNGAPGCGKSTILDVIRALFIPHTSERPTSNSTRAYNIDQSLDGTLNLYDEKRQYDESEDLSKKTVLTSGTLEHHVCSRDGPRRQLQRFVTSIISNDIICTDRAVPIDDLAAATRYVIYRMWSTEHDDVGSVNTNLFTSCNASDRSVIINRVRLQQLRVAMLMQSVVAKVPYEVTLPITTDLLKKWMAYTSRYVATSTYRGDEQILMMGKTAVIINAINNAIAFQPDGTDVDSESPPAEALTPMALMDALPRMHDSQQIAVWAISTIVRSDADPLLKVVVQALLEMAKFPVAEFMPSAIEREFVLQDGTWVLAPAPAQPVEARTLRSIIAANSQRAESEKTKWERMQVLNTGDAYAFQDMNASQVSVNYVELSFGNKQNFVSSVRQRVACFYPRNVFYDNAMVEGAILQLAKMHYHGNEYEKIPEAIANDPEGADTIQLKVVNPHASLPIVKVDFRRGKLYVAVEALDKLITYERFVNYMEEVLSTEHARPRELLTALPKRDRMHCGDKSIDYYRVMVRPRANVRMQILNPWYENRERSARADLLFNRQSARWCGQSFLVDCDVDEWCFWLHNIRNLTPPEMVERSMTRWKSLLARICEVPPQQQPVISENTTSSSDATQAFQ